MSRSRLVLGVLVPAAFVAALVAFVWTRREDLEPVVHAPAGDLVLITALAVAGHLLNSVEYWALYRAVGVRVGVVENWLLFAIGQLLNHAPAQAGTLYKFRYMKAVRAASYARSTTVYGANLAVTALAGGVVGLAAVLGEGARAGGDLSLVMLAVFAAAVAGAALLALAPLPRFDGRSGRIAGAWQSFHDGWQDLRAEPGAALVATAFEAAKLLLTAWRFDVAFDLLGVDESFFFFLVLAPAASVASAVAVTPGAIGFREGFLAGAATAMGASFDTGLLAATVDRAITLAVTIALGAVGFFATYPRLRASGATGAGDEVARTSSGMST